MDFLKKATGWLFGKSQALHDEQDGADRSGAVTQKVVRVPRQPVLSDALRGYNGGVQGLRWYLESLLADAYGNIACEVLQVGSSGRLQRLSKSERTALEPERLDIASIDNGTVTVRYK